MNPEDKREILGLIRRTARKLQIAAKLIGDEQLVRPLGQAVEAAKSMLDQLEAEAPTALPTDKHLQ